MAEWWQRFGNVSQIASAVSGLGIGALVFVLQSRVANDAALSRTSDAIARYHTFAHSARGELLAGTACGKIVVELSGKMNMDRLVGSKPHLFVSNILAEATKAGVDVDLKNDQTTCFDDMKAGADRFEIFEDRFNLLLSTLSDPLLGWQSLPSSSKEIINEAMHSDICENGSTKELYTIAGPRSQKLSTYLSGLDYKSLGDYVREKCV